MRKPTFGNILYVVSGLWVISIGLGMIVSVIQGLRK